MSEVGAPWLPAPALWALAALVAVLVGGLAWRMAGAGPPRAGPAQ
jgi:hypothetical protein